MKHVEVSLFNGVRGKAPARQIALEQVVHDIKSDTYKDQINEIRNHIKGGSKKDAENLKRELDAVTTSGIFSKRNKISIDNYSGLLCLDFDNISESKIDALRKKVEVDKHTVVCFLSPSGNGLKVVVWVETSSEEHESAFKQADDYFYNLLNLRSDPSCKDISRLCFLSYDSDIYYNPSAEQFSVNINNKNTNHTADLKNCREFTDNRVAFEDKNRNNYLYQFACNACRRKIPHAATLQYCLREFESVDFLEDEIKGTVRSAFNQELPNSMVENAALTALSVIDLINDPSFQTEITPIWAGIIQPSVNFIFGISKSGKSTLTESLGMAIALGSDHFLDYRIDGPKRVLLVSLEEFAGLRRQRLGRQASDLSTERRELLRQNYLISPRNFPSYIITESNWNALQGLIMSSGVDIVFIDSLSHIQPGQSIEDSGTATRIMRRFRDIATELNVAIVLVHHTPKDVSEGKPLGLHSLAGSRILLQEAEFYLGVNRTPNERRYVKEVASRYTREASYVTVFDFDENNLVQMVETANESVLLRDFDGRTDTQNYDMLKAYISGKTDVESSELESEFIESKKMSRGTLYNNLKKLEEDNEIEKPFKGVYRTKGTLEAENI